MQHYYRNFCDAQFQLQNCHQGNKPTYEKDTVKQKNQKTRDVTDKAGSCWTKCMPCTCSYTVSFFAVGAWTCSTLVCLAMDGWISDTLTVSGVDLHPWDLPQHNAHAGTHVWASHFCSNTPRAPWVGLIWGRLSSLCDCMCVCCYLV